MARATTRSDTFAAIAEPQRRRILSLLAEGERSVNELVEALGARQPQVSKHLRVLRDVGLVSARRSGQRRLYRLNGGGLQPIDEWVRTIERSWSERLERLDHYLQQQISEENVMATQPLSSSPDSATEPRIVITRVFDAPRSRVFKAWTDPEQLKQWFGPRTFTNPHLTADVRPGGTLLGAMRSPDGQDYWYKGVYREIVEPERIVYVDMFADEHGNAVPASHYGMSEDFPLETLVTVTFEDLGDKTRMTLEHVGLPVSEGENAAAGWSESFDKLAEYLKTS